MSELINDLPCVYFSSNSEDYIIEANEALCHLLEYTQKELIGVKLESIFTLSTRIFNQTHFYPLLQLKGHAEEIYITLNTKSNHDVPVLINALRKETNGQTLMHFAGISVSKRKKFEEEIIAAKKAAEKALTENSALKATQEELQKRTEELDKQFELASLQNQELKQFNHLATHTLQEPLRKLMFFTNRILESKEEKNYPSVAEKINKAALDIQIKLRGLQQFAWLANQETKYEKVELLRIAENAREKIELENPDVHIILESEAIPVIEANSQQMLILFKELLSNTVRFRKSLDMVLVNIYASALLLNKFKKLEEKYKYQEFVKLQIKDNSIGFDDRFQAQAFEIFRKLHSNSGAGIGLTLCKKIVENHGGSISLESQINKGTIMTIFLPINQKHDLHEPQK